MQTVTVTMKDGHGGFHLVEGATVITRSRGTYSQRELYQRRRQLYAKIGSAYIGLLASGYTSSGVHQWDEIVPSTNQPFAYKQPRVGYLEVA